MQLLKYGNMYILQPMLLEILHALKSAIIIFALLIQIMQVSETKLPHEKNK